MIYSLAKINEMADGDQEFIQSIIQVFLDEVPLDLKELKQAVDSGDFEQIYKLSHKIKPNVDLLGMESTRVLALEMEQMGRNNSDLEGIRERFPQFARDVEQVISELQNDFKM
jgi:HPt (histidine-containing phosphotransfer) domain-containing protein